jgi:sterol desaturase/sphingolipid hydroxylase (fatty acid hydroxylase superfamily)
MRTASEPEIETLLDGAARARLPLARQLLIYLDPFALFKDASSGPAPARARALSYNRAMRWMLLSYIRRWIVIAAALAVMIAPAEAAAAQQELFAIPMAAIAVGCCIAVTVVAVTAAVYLLLGRRVV